MSSNKSNCSLNFKLQQVLLDLAKLSINHGLVNRTPFPVGLNGLTPELSVKRATFVTLTIQSELRGCIGTLTAVRALAEDIAQNAFAAAFKDPRFPPLAENELARLNIHLSLLTPAELLSFSSEDELLSLLVPFEDGLILEDGARRGTFLPFVWESLPEPRIFLQHLKMKAGLPRDYWSDTLKISRYHTEMIHQ
jgi:AmmeMemoRadiSam system protein A